MTLEQKIAMYEYKIANHPEDADKLIATLADLKDEIRYKNPVGRFVPKRGNTYYYVSKNGKVYFEIGCGYDYDKDIISHNNTFRYSSSSKENLKKYSRDVLRVQNRLMQLHEELCSEYWCEPNTKNHLRYCIFYNNASKLWSYAKHDVVCIPSVPFTYEAAEKACEILNTEKFMMEE